jgi:hypothetical protein
VTADPSTTAVAGVETYDTTLRDGSQQVGLNFTVADKLHVTQLLDDLGVDLIEGGWPGSNPKDAEYFARVRELELRHATLAAFGATRRPRSRADDDPNLLALLDCGAPVLTLVGKAWTLHVTEALRTSYDENLAMVADSVAYLVAEGRRVVFDAEHFFDGYAADPAYAVAVAEAAAAALTQLTYGAFLSVAVQTSEERDMPYDDVYAIATPGRAFDMFTNQASALRTGGPRRPGGSLMLFAGGRGAAALTGSSDEEIRERFLTDLYALYPATRGVVARATVHRWELGNVYARPGRGRLQPALEGPLGAHRNLHLAGDYFAELGNMEAAARTGLAAAERVDARIREVTHA